MTDFERAVVAAYLARREHGEGSREYARALVEMETLRPRRRFCADCGRPEHPDQTCIEAAA